MKVRQKEAAQSKTKDESVARWLGGGGGGGGLAVFTFY